MSDKCCTIVIPHHNRHDHLKNLLDCLDNQLFDIVIVSGGSFAENCNKGAKLAETDKILIMNDDIIINTDDIIELCSALNFVDVVGSTQITKSNEKYFGIGFDYMDNNNMFKRSNYYYPIVKLKPNETLFPSGFLLGFRKNAWEKLNGFNTDFKTGYEDVDLGIRCIKNNFKICILDLEIYHYESESIGRFTYQEENTKLLHQIYNQKYLKNLYENTNYCI